mgnify:CR=1 FL=1
MYASTVRVAALAFVGVLVGAMLLGLTHLTAGHTLTGTDAPCGHEVESVSWCPAAVSDALASWESAFVGVVGLFGLVGLAAACVAVVVRWPHSCVLITPTVIQCHIDRNTVRLTDFLRELFARGILHPKLYDRMR